MELSMLEKRQTLSDLALERILEVIVKGDLKPGERVQEAILARQLGISRGPLREAIRRLEGRRLLVRIPHVGVKVAETSAEQVLEIFMMREALEGVACRLAAERMDDEEIDQLEALLASHGDQSDLRSGDGYYQNSGDQDFHFRIIKGGRSKPLEETLLGDLYEFLRIFRYRSSIKPGRAIQAHAEHEEVLKALRARDPEAAERAMRTHLSNARLSLEQSLKQQVSA